MDKLLERTIGGRVGEGASYGGLRASKDETEPVGPPGDQVVGQTGETFGAAGTKEYGKTNEADLDEITMKDGRITVKVFLEVIAGAITRYDMQLSKGERKRGSENIYRAGHLLKALDSVRKATKAYHDQESNDAMDNLISAMKKYFIFEHGRFSITTLNKVLKKIEEYKRSGKEPKYEAAVDEGLKPVRQSVISKMVDSLLNYSSSAANDPSREPYAKDVWLKISKHLAGRVSGQGNSIISALGSAVRSKKWKEAARISLELSNWLSKVDIDEATEYGVEETPMEAKGKGTEFECQECLKRFRKKIGPHTVDVKCPKCKGYDTLPTDFFGRSSKVRTQNEAKKGKTKDLHFAGYDFTSGPEGTKIKRKSVDLKKKGDYGADPLGNGKFKMVPSGDVVDKKERDRRLSQNEGKKSSSMTQAQMDKDAEDTRKIMKKAGISKEDPEFKKYLLKKTETSDPTVGAVHALRRQRDKAAKGSNKERVAKLDRALKLMGETWRDRFFSDILTEASDPPVIRELRRIIDRKQYGKAGGQKVDLYTASAIVNVYDQLSTSNKTKLVSMPLVKMSDVAFKLIKKTGG